MERKNTIFVQKTKRRSYHFDDDCTTLGLNLQRSKWMRVVQQDAFCILRSVFRGNGGDMGKRNTENL
jgi:hypothetical protein